MDVGFVASFYSPGTGEKWEEGWESVWEENQGGCRTPVSIPTPFRERRALLSYPKAGTRVLFPNSSEVSTAMPCFLLRTSRDTKFVLLLEAR